MEESNLMLVFFDTFSHGIKPEVQVDPIRFSQPVKIGLIRIIPFGIAIESEIDSEARLGVTNPQNFNVKFYVHSSADSPAFEKIGEMDFDEKNGVNSISFPSMPLASMLTINGCYNMLSIAIFGIISPQAHSSAKVVANQMANNAGQHMQMFGLNNQNMYTSNPLGIRAILGQSGSLNLSNIGTQIPSRAQSNQSASNILMSLAIAAGQQAATDPSQLTTDVVKDEMLEDAVCKTESTLGLYEDGEIQEIDYEDVSSNEDLLFGMDDDGDFIAVEPEELNQEGEVAIQSVINGTTTTAIKKISTGFPDLDKRLMTERWRFLPKRIVSQGQLITELKVLPNSYKTLYEVELDRLCREERENNIKRTTKDMSSIDITSSMKVESKVEQSHSTSAEESSNNIDDIPDSADRLINLVSTYGESNLTSEWVEQMEELPKSLASGFAYLTYADKDTADYVVESLITWVKVGLNMEAALRQSENMYILRHIKAGITLAGLMCSLNNNIASRVLAIGNDGFNVQHSLIDLLESAIIATPLKLHIIGALDLSTRLNVGLDRFIGVERTLKNHETQTPYQRFLCFMLQKNTARVNMANVRLINKVHLYEVLFTFEAVIDKERNAQHSDGTPQSKTEASRLLREIIRYFIHARELIANPRRSMPCSKLFDDTLHRPHNPYPNLLSMMQSTNLLVSIDWILGQATIMPKKKDDREEVQCKGLVEGALRLIWELAQRHESLVYLMSASGKITNVILRRLFALNPDNAGSECVPDSIGYQQHWFTLGLELAYKLEALRFIDELLSWSTHHGGLQGLAKQHDLLEDAQLAGILLGLAKLTGERRGAAWIAQVITMDDNLAPILPIFEALETKTLAEDRGDCDTKMDHYLSNNTNETTRVPLPHSICLHYLPNLLTAIIRHADNATYLGKYGSRLASLGKDGTTSPFVEAHEWLQPLRELPSSSPLDIDCVEHFVEHLKSSCSEMDAANIPSGLITVLRILKLHMVTVNTNRPHYLPNTESHVDQDPYELPEGHVVDYVRYKYAITEFYHHDGLTVLNKLIQQISDNHQLSWQCAIESIDNRYPLLLCIAEPATAIIRAVTQRLMESRGNQFKDTTGLLPLFSCYTIFCSKLYFGQQISSTRYQGQLENIRHSILDTVLTYTQSQLPDEENEKVSDLALDKSLWTCMLKELLNFTLSAPYAFAGGLSLLLELLPLPLPIITNVPLTQEETVQVKSARTLWSAHILCVRQELKKVIHTIGCSSNHTLIALLSRLINLISGLGPSTALMLSQNCLETLTEVWERVYKDMIEHNEHVESLTASESSTNQEEASSNKDNINKSGDDLNTKDIPVSSSSISSGVNQTLLRTDSLLGIDAKIKFYPDSIEMTRLWCMVKLVLSVPACKHAFLKLIGQKPHYENIDLDQTLETAFFRIISELMDANKENHTTAQENMINCLQLLLDGRIVMLSCVEDMDIEEEEMSCDSKKEWQNGMNRVLTKQELINGLPSRSQTLLMVGWLARHCVNPDQDMTTIPGALRPLVALAGHDYGFRILLEVFDQQPGILLTLIKRVNETFSADNPDCQVTLLTTLSLLQALVVKQDTNNDSPHLCKLPPRTLNLSDAYVRQVLQWKGDKEANSTHPVSELHGLLKIVSEEEESLHILRDGMESLIELLSMNDMIVGNIGGVEGTQEDMPLAQTLEEMYESRGIWQRERNSLGEECREWIGPVNVSADREAPELTRCDLENLAYVCCNGFNLHEELARGRQQDDEAIRHKRRRRGHDAIIHTSGRSSKKFVAPMRGRGFGVRSNQSSSSLNNDRHDSFRSRPPNTSRPPSMHVDDFQKLQKDDKLDEEIMVRERNLRNLRGGRSGVRTINQGSRSVSTTDQTKMPPPSGSSRSRQLK